MNLLSMMYVTVGGAVGSLARYLVIHFVNRINTTSFPFGTFSVNILGGFLMGFWIGAMAFTTPPRSKDLHLLFAIGVLGGFTTFSAFSTDIFLLLDHGKGLIAALYVVSSVVCRYWR